MKSLLRRWCWQAGAPVRALLIALIWIYRATLGQLVGGQCRFYPSCSAYAEGAIRGVGWMRGSALSIWRILRCNPMSAGGVDHAPTGRRGTYENVILRTYDSAIPSPGRVRKASALGEVETSANNGPVLERKEVPAW